MRPLGLSITTYRVSDFLEWQRQKTLDLTPAFQRRAVWRTGARSLYIDTVVRGLPSPVIYLREKTSVSTQRTIREVVDGQQRLRTLFAYISPDILPEYDEKRDAVKVRKIHNSTIAGKRFSNLSESIQHQILGYEFSCHVLPSRVEDREILQIFARLNATGVKLNAQELRNAEFFGSFKTSMYKLAFEQLDRWRQWRVFTEDQIARMKEVELVSDIAASSLGGIASKSQPAIKKLYGKYDEDFPGMAEFERRFRAVLDEIDDLLGEQIANTIFRREVFFYSLFILLYEQMFGLASTLARTKGKRLTKSLARDLASAGSKFESEKVPARVLDAARSAPVNAGQRKIRHKYLVGECGGKAS